MGVGRSGDERERERDRCVETSDYLIGQLMALLLMAAANLQLNLWQKDENMVELF